LAFQGKLWPAVTRQQIELESCSNPVMTSGFMWFRFKKFFFNLVRGFWANGIMTGTCILVNYMTSSSDPMRQYFGSQYFWILGENTHF